MTSWVASLQELVFPFISGDVICLKNDFLLDEIVQRLLLRFL